VSRSPSEIARAAALGFAVLLVAIVCGWQLTTRNVEHAVLAFLFSIPVLAPLRGLYRRKRRTFRWATLCVTPYFVVGLTEVISDPSARNWSAAMLIAGLLWFAALVAYLRVTNE